VAEKGITSSSGCDKVKPSFFFLAGAVSSISGCPETNLAISVAT